MDEAMNNENAAIRFVDRHADEPCSTKDAFVEAGSGRSLTYAGLAERSGRLAALYERHGIEPGERVALLLLDRIAFPVTFWGSLKAGVVPVPLNTLLSTDVYRAILADCGAAALVVSPELLGAVRPLLDGHPTIRATFVESAHPPDGTLGLDDELLRGEVREPVAAAADDVAFWLYSSGSTGRPKGVRHRHASLGVTADTYGREVLGVEPGDVVFSAAKLFFAYGLGNAMTFPLSVGATTVLHDGRPSPDAVLDVLERCSPTVFCGVPTLYAALASALESSGARVPALRRCISAGEALPEGVARAWERLGGAEILDGVGSTEMLHVFLSNRAGDVAHGTSGVAVPGYELRLVDEAGAPVEVGGIGELLVRGGSAPVDYWGQPERSAATFEGGWTRTGDKYVRGEARLTYCGRTDDMFKVGGIWLSPFEVEQALVSHPAVLEAAVVAERDAHGLDKPKAFVVLKPGAGDGPGAGGTDLIDSLKAHVKERVGKWKYPRSVELVEELPKTATGKIQRFRLREQST